MDAQEAMERYEEFLVGNGNSERVRKMYCKWVAGFLDEHPEALDVGEDELRSICDSYVEGLPLTQATELVAAAVRFFWSMRFGKRYFKRVYLSSFPEDEAIEREGELFEAFLVGRGKAESTAAAGAASIKRFLYTTFPGGSFSRGAVCADAVRSYISTHLADAAPSTSGLFVTHARAYARFLMSEGCENAAGIALLPLRAPTRKGDVGPVLSEEGYLAILAAADEGTPCGMRDRAMVMLMGNLGMRSSDVARLTLDDVDWDRGQLHVRKSKSKAERVLPLDADTGGAIERYVVGWRASAETESRALFLPTGQAAGRPSMSPQQVRRAARNLAVRAGVREYRGTHALRRAAATSMIRGGASVKVVADVLGHEDVTTTMPYLALDAETLRKACSPWPEGGAI